MGLHSPIGLAGERPLAGTDQDLVGRAEAMIPVLRARGAATEADRRPSEETRADLKRAGFARAFQPRRYGGTEARLSTGVDVLAAIGRGCGSTAWILVQNMTHTMLLAAWPEEAQDTIWGDTPDVLVSGIFIPGIGKARPVEGGYLLSGRWPFVSGVDIADWLLFSADCPNPDGGVDDRHFLVRAGEARIVDTWYTIGLKGSASNDVVAEEVFVPGHMSVTMEQLKGHGRAPGYRANPAPLYWVPPHALFGTYIGAAALGIAEAAVEHYLAGVRTRVASMSGVSLASYTTQQVKVAEAQSAVLAARRLLHSICEEAQGKADAGQTFGVEDKARYRALATYAGKLSASAVNIVLEAGGGGVIYDRHPLSRCVADMTVASRHTTQNWDVNASAYGRVLMGLPIGVAALDD